MSVAAKIKLFHRSLMAMNTQLDVIFWGSTSEICEAAFIEIQGVLQHWELILSRYHRQAEVFDLNNSPKNKAVKISSGLFRALELAQQFHSDTKGYFDIRLGNTYHEIKHGREAFDKPARPYHESLLLDKTMQTVTITDPAVSLDFGGMGKGLALNDIATCIDSFSINNAFISFGGSAVLTRGSHPHGSYWRFSLSEAYGNSGKSWQLNNHAVSVSSSKRKQSHLVENHIFNPQENEIVNTSKTVIIINNEPTEAEVLSTALLAAPQKQHPAIIAQFKECTIDII
ncbi:FAD:protein FMN transferase [Roseimarinus sediminis]|uniref:FAD:protein FMN transferase n=1 Tax=Roseimarinus sediminis TaxID=1610899 RepID=UPI003D20B8DB